MWLFLVRAIQIFSKANQLSFNWRFLLYKFLSGQTLKLSCPAVLEMSPQYGKYFEFLSKYISAAQLMIQVLKYL
jgi:hypothetical protein